MKTKDFESFGFAANYKTDSISGDGYYEFVLKQVNVVYTICESGQRDIYTIYVGPISDYARELVSNGSKIFRGKIETIEEFKILLKMLGINEDKKD